MPHPPSPVAVLVAGLSLLAGPPIPISAQTEREVTIESERGIRLAGTLVTPDGPGPHRSAILVSGSGPQDRDESVAGMKPFRLLAELLVTEGIATLRMDDPGIGGSTGEWATSTMSDLEVDLRSALHFLRRKPGIEASGVGLIGHSEGGVIAMSIAGHDPDVAFLVLLASPVAPIPDVLMAQTESVLRVTGASEKDIARHHEVQRETFRAIRTGRGWEHVNALTEAVTRDAVMALPADQQAMLGDLNAVIAAQVEQQLQLARAPWFQSLALIDPRESLRAVRAPVLALFGENDLQVPSGLNREAAETTLSGAEHPDFEIVVIPGANHLFQDGGTGHPGEYTQLAPRFTPELSERLTLWLRGRTGGDR
jgi:hypothetical protein